jgi:L,D-peptidoglycan transpeptidase YkuD (ErfK/YbiS/YcfS/YnhG family)
MAKGWLLGLLVALPVQAQLPGSQVVVVLTKDWTAPTGQLYRFEKNKTAWQQVGTTVPVVVGKNGLGWGNGLLPAQAGPLKQEGDGRAPAGIFSLGDAYGYAPSPPPGTTFPYHQSTDQSRCVDDSSSSFYNQIVPLREPLPWTSAEEMRRSDDLYRLLLVINHNTNPPRPQGGSCIFMHIWRAPDRPTVGCTAMAPDNLTNLVQWLKLSQQPVLVQLPQAVYQTVQGRLGLPDLTNLPSP